MTKLAALTTLFVLVPLVADSKPVMKPMKKVSVKKPVSAKQVAPPPVADDADQDPYVDPIDVRRKELPPAPDSDVGYVAWKNKLTTSQRQRVERFCRVDRPADYEPHCGGIGLHRIPAPPPLMDMPTKDGTPRSDTTRADHNAWKAGLSRVQRASYEHLCSKETYAFTELCGGTPLVVAFDNQAVAFMSASSGPDWPTVATPWLAMDRDGDGAISSGAELFGDATVLSNGRTAKHGFDALASLDRNGDGRIDRADPMFASLVLWADRDGNRVSSPGELTPASSTIESIELGYTLEPRCDARLNCEREKSVMRYRDATGASRTGSIVDVYLHHR